MQSPIHAKRGHRPVKMDAGVRFVSHRQLLVAPGRDGNTDTLGKQVRRESSLRILHQAPNTSTVSRGQLCPKANRPVSAARFGCCCSPNQLAETSTGSPSSSTGAAGAGDAMISRNSRRWPDAIQSRRGKASKQPAQLRSSTSPLGHLWVDLWARSSGPAPRAADGADNDASVALGPLRSALPMASASSPSNSTHRKQCSPRTIQMSSSSSANVQGRLPPRKLKPLFHRKAAGAAPEASA
jgi:hypothetical protein